jgi:hypothetical protein
MSAAARSGSGLEDLERLFQLLSIFWINELFNVNSTLSRMTDDIER